MPKEKKSTNLVEDYNIVSVPKSYISLLYGVLTVLVLFAIIFLVVQLFVQRKGEISNQAEKTEISMETEASVYTVKEGDTLWKIAEEKYNDGYKWSEIAKANNIANPNVITKDMKLKLPSLAKTTAAPAFDQESTSTINAGIKITGNTYTVVKGDNLWKISVRAYGDGYKWSEIAKANNLVNPNVIHPGNVFKLPR